MAFNISYIYEAIDNFSSVANRINDVVEESQRKFKSLSESVSQAGQKMTDIGKSASLKLTAPIAAIATVSLRAAAATELATTQMATLLGSMEKAQALSKELERIKMTSPVDPHQVDAAARRLLVMGVEVDKVSGLIKTFGDISAGSGIPLEHLTNLFAQAKSGPEGMSRALTALSRQMPIMESMQAIFREKFNMNLTTEQIRELISQGKVGFDVFQASFERLTKEGGRFYNAMNSQSTTLSGSFRLLRNNFEVFSEEVGAAIAKSANLGPVIASISEKLGKLAHFIGEFAEAHPTVTRYIVLFGALLAALGPVLIVVGQMVIGFGFLIKAVGSITIAFAGIGKVIGFVTQAITFLRTSMLLLNAAFVANPIGVLIAACIGLSYVLSLLYSKFEGFKNIVDTVFGGAWKGIKFFIESAIMLITDFIKLLDIVFSKIGSLASSIGGAVSAPFKAIGNLFGGSNESTLVNNNIVAGAAGRNESVSEVNINLRGNIDAVQSVQASTKGNTNLNLGQNMAYGGI